MGVARKLRFDQQNRTDQKRILGKPARWLYPVGPAFSYFNDLKAAVGFMIELTEQMLIPMLPSLSRQANALRPDRADSFDPNLWPVEFTIDETILDALKNDSDWDREGIYNHILETKQASYPKWDAYPEELSKIIEGIEVRYLDTYTPQVTTEIASKAALSINAFNANQFQKVMKSVLGVNVFITEPWLTDAMKAFVGDNVALIKSLSSDYFSQIETITFRGLRSGARHEDIAKEIRKRYGVTRNRARLIARDQTNKFNGQLTQLRQQSAGIKEYVWQTVGDKRVRTAHKNRDGVTFKWSNPPADGHPGEAVQCRCYAEPIVTSEIALKFTGQSIKERK